MTLHDLFAASFVSQRDLPAVVVDDPASGGVRTLTFGDIDARASRMAAVLTERGVARGDRVAVYLANRIEFVDLFLACLRIGAVLVPMNILYKTRELNDILSDAEPRIVVAAADSRDVLPGGAPLVALAELVDEASRTEPASAPVPIGDDDLALIIYTSGTTGRSKGAALTHANVVANTSAIISSWRITSADRYLAVLPLFHVHGLANGICSWLATGFQMRLVERFDRDRIATLFETFEPTLFFGVPTMYVRMLDFDADTARRIGAAARLFVSGSAPLPVSVFEAFRARFGHAILERYGMSETLMLISNPYGGERRAGTVGQPLPGVSVRIVDPDGRDVGPGETGQVLVRGANVFHGYWRNPAATAAAFDGSWFRTGDLGVRSADGYCSLQGRASDLIITGGFNVYPREIEERLLAFPGVIEAAVVGAPDAVRGEVPVAYVVAGADFDPDLAREACAREMASFKVPRAFVRVEALPRNALGKVQKQLLPRSP